MAPLKMIVSLCESEFHQVKCIDNIFPQLVSEDLIWKMQSDLIHQNNLLGNFLEVLALC